MTAAETCLLQTIEALFLKLQTHFFYRIDVFDERAPFHSSKIQLMTIFFISQFCFHPFSSTYAFNELLRFLLMMEVFLQVILLMFRNSLKTRIEGNERLQKSRFE